MNENIAMEVQQDFPNSRAPSPDHDLVELNPTSPSCIMNLNCNMEEQLLFTPRSGKRLLLESDDFLNANITISTLADANSDKENRPPVVGNNVMNRDENLIDENKNNDTDETFAESIENLVNDLSAESMSLLAPTREHNISDETFAESIEDLAHDLGAENMALEPSCEEKENANSNNNEKSIKRVRNPQKRLENLRNKHLLLPPCSDTCIKKCSSLLNEVKRDAIWSKYWSLNTQRRRDFISRNVQRKPVAVRYARSRKRSCTLEWSLSGQKVCKTMFLHTIGYNHDQVVQAVLKANFKSGDTVNGSVSAAPDLRGKHTPPHAFSTEQVRAIEEEVYGFRPMPSHYNSEHAPNRLYLPTGCTFKQVFNHVNSSLLQKGYRKCAWSSFMKIIKKNNISTAMPKQDLCTKCTEHAAAHPTNTDEQNISNHDCSSCECDSCDGFLQHISNKNIARKFLNEDFEEASRSEGKIGLYTSDLQKVISVPKLATKDFFFSRKLIMYNETFATTGKNGNSVVVLWHEGESGRKATNIATTYIQFAKKHCRDLEKLILYMDNCNAQNKNKTLYSALLRLVHDNQLNIKTLKIVYLEPGHTYMSADSVHSSIAKKLNAAGELYDFNDYVELIKQSRRNLEVQVLDHQDFLVLEDEMKAKFPTNYNITKFKVVEFRRGFTNLFVKVKYDEEFCEIDVYKMKLKREIQKIIKNAYNISSFLEIPHQEIPHGVSKLKKLDLLKLTKSMPVSRRGFYENLRINEDIEDDDVRT